jgi:hypothetical protein
MLFFLFKNIVYAVNSRHHHTGNAGQAYFFIDSHPFLAERFNGLNSLKIIILPNLCQKKLLTAAGGPKYMKTTSRSIRYCGLTSKKRDLKSGFPEEIQFIGLLTGEYVDMDI